MKQPPTFAIRPLKKGDREHVRELFRATYLAYTDTLDPAAAAEGTEHVRKSLQEDLADPFAHYMRSPGTCFFVAVIDGQVAGMAGVDRWAEDATAVEIRRVAVGHQFRRRGIAKGLMAHAESWAASHGYEMVRLYTVEYFTEAIAMYEGLGYRLVAEHNWGRVKGLEYEKPLKAPTA